MKTKLMIMIASLTLSTATLASTITAGKITSKKKKSSSRPELTLETEYSQKKNDEGKIVGSESYLQIEPGYRFNKKSTLSFGATYKIRDNNSDSERKNRDHLDEAYVKFLYKATKFKDNGIGDVRLQARVYQSTDSFFREFYGSDGNYQLRAYFGRPLVGSALYLNKYTTYVRYKKYLANSNSGSKSRDYELRMRVSPTYRIMDSLEASATFTYNHIFERGATDSEEIEMSPSLRYNWDKGTYAVMLRGGFPLLNDDNENSTLKSVENNLELTTYALTFSAYL